jgi:hypothetical protein
MNEIVEAIEGIWKKSNPVQYDNTTRDATVILRSWRTPCLALQLHF